ncbi:MAG: 16S rRNA (guanine(966)-N(2))-methyltransferase RsmD [Brevinema sp.]
MRISSGIWRGRNLLAPEGKLKPTSDKVRQAFFNTIRTEITGARFLDLFAGSGSVGITAISEGASFAGFVERDSDTYRALRENLDKLVDRSQYQTFRTNVEKVPNLFPEESFDIVFADPFYPDISGFLKKLHHDAMNLLKEDGIFTLEHGKKIKIEELQSLNGYQNTKYYGDTALSYFKKTETADEA